MYLGVDFGTSFSKVSTISLNQAMLLHPPGEYGVPSEFYYDMESDVLIGQDALDAGQGENAVNLKSEIKMELITPFTADGRTFQPKEIVQAILRNLISKAIIIARQHALNEQIEGIVITVPAKFGTQERNLIRSAAQTCIPGQTLPVRAILKEPVAAALSYYQDTFEENRSVLVYDLGGGTCDIALVHADPTEQAHYKVVDSDMLRIGGRNWDQALTKYLVDKLGAQGIAVNDNPAYLEKIRRAAIAIKRDLSEVDVFTGEARERAVSRIEINGRIVRIPITRGEFNEITMPLLKQTLAVLQDIYDKYSVEYQINEIICVGGSSNMTQVPEEIKRAFPDCAVRVYVPEHAVVNGAACYAELIKDDSTAGVVLQDFANFSYGTESHVKEDGEFKRIVSNILKKGEALPVATTKSYSPLRDNQERVVFEIYESDFVTELFAFTISEKRYVGTVVVNLPPNTPATAAIFCELKLNRQGLLEVCATGPSGEPVHAEFLIAEL